MERPQGFPEGTARRDGKRAGVVVSVARMECRGARDQLQRMECAVAIAESDAGNEPRDRSRGWLLVAELEERGLVAQREAAPWASSSACLIR